MLKSTLSGLLKSVLLICPILLAAPASAEKRYTLGFGRMLTNDFFGDGFDQWHTGSYAISVVRGTGWTGTAPLSFGSVIEYRWRSSILAPSNIERPAEDDRRYAGTMTFGAHSHMNWEGVDLRAGLDLVLVGPQTGLDQFQKDFHDWVGLVDPSAATENQIGNATYMMASGEAARSFDVSSNSRLRTFAEAQVGVENLVRLGGDFIIGEYGVGDLLIRDVESGQLYRSVAGSGPGVSFILGADAAYVADSIYLPEDEGYQLTDARYRARAAVHWHGERFGVFYGLTWLSEEFEAQKDSQVVGSLHLEFQF